MEPRGSAGRVVRARSVLRQAGMVTIGVLLYFGIRGLTAQDGPQAVRHARALVSWESSLGLYHEQAVQDLVHRADVLVTVANWVYIWGHWPVIAVSLVWLVLSHPPAYRVTRNAMLASGLVGLVIFALYPVAPPRLADLGLVDTVTERSQSYRVLQPQAFVNQYAAMPSLHVGWDLLIGIALVTSGGHLLIRAIGVLLPVLMLISVIATANHYIVDAVAGIVLVLGCRAVAARLERRTSTPAPVPPADVRIPRPRAASDPDRRSARR